MRTDVFRSLNYTYNSEFSAHTRKLKLAAEELWKAAIVKG